MRASEIKVDRRSRAGLSARQEEGLDHAME
jgi:hypothetical protein